MNVVLMIGSNVQPEPNGMIAGLNAAQKKGAGRKTLLLTSGLMSHVPQHVQIQNPDARISLTTETESTLLAKYARSFQGIATADYARFGRCFWELPSIPREWEFQQSTVKRTVTHGGREHIFLWEGGDQALLPRIHKHVSKDWQHCTGKV